jgi:hypothetical protein
MILAGNRASPPLRRGEGESESGVEKKYNAENLQYVK